MTFAVIDDMELPSPQRGKYPISALEVNQGFFVPAEGEDKKRIISSLRSATSTKTKNLKAKGEERRYRVVSTPDGVKVKRVV